MNKTEHKKHNDQSLLMIFISLFIIAGVANPPGSFMNDESEKGIINKLNECTTGLASGFATPDSRPLLWKNRDVGGSQEFHYVDDGRIPFISITYTNDTDDYYGGINEAGFAVENSNSYNLERGPGSNGWGGDDDDGEIHYLALATCRTVDDFEALMDSTNEDGRTLRSNYGTIDAFGGAAMFEAGGYSYTRYDAIEAEGGFIVRSNYSYSGNLNNRDNYGGSRHDRALEQFQRGWSESNLTPKFLFQCVVRNLCSEDCNPYPLPFDGYYGNYGYGRIPNSSVVCRSTTAGVIVAQGVAEDEDPRNAILWSMCGNPYGTIALPLWVRAGSVPPEFDSNLGSRIDDRSDDLRFWASSEGSGVDTWKLVNPQGTGLWDYTFALEDWVFEKTAQFVNSPRFDYNRLEAFQNSIACQISDSLDAWEPKYVTTEIFEPEIARDGVRINWRVTDFYRDHSPRGYNLYRSAEPFRNGESGELLAYVEELEFTDTEPLAGSAFYRVEGVY
ncbi:hypothetical protein K9N50_10920 [bacterium]|nr:hypothetical protein [bacterium]